MKKVIIGGIIIAGITAVWYNNKLESQKTRWNKQVALSKIMENGSEANIYNRFSNDEISLFYDLFVLKKYGNNIPNSEEIKVRKILLRFGIVPNKK